LIETTQQLSHLSHSDITKTYTEYYQHYYFFMRCL